MAIDSNDLHKLAVDHHMQGSCLPLSLHLELDTVATTPDQEPLTRTELQGQMLHPVPPGPGLRLIDEVFDQLTVRDRSNGLGWGNKLLIH